MPTNHGFDELHDTLRRDGISMVMARNIGQVREVFATQDSSDLGVYPTVREAVRAMMAVNPPPEADTALPRPTRSDV